MTALQARYPCPVCLGVKMEKVRLSDGGPRERGQRRTGELVLDHCPRCGGVWFEAGEVQRLRSIDAEALWREIVRREDVHRMQCHACRALFPRSESACTACGWKVELCCPVCGDAMRIEERDGMRLDYCARDKGVWFDHDELTGIWKMEARDLARRRGTPATGEADALDALLYVDPFLLYYGAHAAAHLAGGAAHALAASGAGEVVGEAAGAMGEIASSLFETIAEIIGGIFG